VHPGGRLHAVQDMGVWEKRKTTLNKKPENDRGEYMLDVS
jgi:hypothetical protein